MKEPPRPCPYCKSKNTIYIGRYGESVEGHDDVTKKIGFYKCAECRTAFRERLPYSVIAKTPNTPHIPNVAVVVNRECSPKAGTGF